MKALADDWVALEDEEDDDDGEGEEVMSALFVEEEEDETDIESNGEEIEVFELFYSTLSYVLLCPEGQHCQF